MDVTIPDLPPGTAPISASPFESVEGGASVRYTLAQIGAAITGGGAGGPYLPLAGGTLTGNLGIGRTPVNLLDMQKDQASGTIARITNASTTGYSAFSVNNSASYTTVAVTGVSYIQTTPYDQNDVYYIDTNCSNGMNLVSRASGPIRFHTGASWSSAAERMRIDASGNVGIGTTTVTNIGTGHTIVDIKGTDVGRSGAILLRSLDDSMKAALYCSGGSTWFGPITATPLLFTTNNTERARITADGFFKASNTGSYASSGASAHALETDVSDGYPVQIIHKATIKPFGPQINFPNTIPNDTYSAFLSCKDQTTYRINFYSNGGIANYSANDVNLSDATLKEDINPYSQQELDSLEQSFKAVQWCRYKYKDQTHSDWNHGYLAQDVATAFANVAPELVEEIDIGTKKEGDPPSLKAAVYATDLTNISHALLARALARIADLEARLTAAGV